MSDLPELSPSELVRYSRHIRLGELGVEGQRRLAAARVLVIGAGGLGSPAALYLAAAGIGTLGIADFDRVEEHNLQRQLLHDTASVGTPKVASAAARLRAINPHIRVVEHGEGVTAGNAQALFAAYDVIVDGTDNFASRYLNNDAAVLARRPLVYASIFKFEAQVAVFDPAHGGPCYRCLFAAPPPAGSVPDCSEAGVLGALCGVAGSLQALEAIKLVTGIGETLRGRLLTYDALSQTFGQLRIARQPGCAVCGEHPEIRDLQPGRYAFHCAPAVPPPRAQEVPLEVSATAAAAQLRADPAGTVLIDVREPYELEICRVAGAEAIPLRELGTRADSLPADRHLLLLCHVGSRSMYATQFLRSRGFRAVSNVAGGIEAWATEVDPSLRRY